MSFSSSDYAVGNLLNDSDAEFLSEPDYNVNRTLFLAYELTNIKQIMRLIDGINEKSMVLIYYKDERYLYELLSKVDLTLKEHKLVFFAGDYKDPKKVDDLDELLRNIIYSFSNMQPMIRKSMDIDYIRGAKEFLRFIGDYRDNYLFLIGNDLNDTLYGLRNRLYNLQDYVKNPGFKEFVDKYGHLYKNKPAVIVSSGPSLDKNVHQLKDYRDKVFILSCDGSLSTLLRHGIKPDIVGSVERIYKAYEAFYEDRSFDDDIFFSGPAVVRPEIIEKFSGKRMLSVFKDVDVYGKWMNEITLEKKGTIWSGASVAHFLTNFADALGCNPIILIGQDLSYSLNGISHAGAAEVKEQVDVSKVTEWVKDYNGNDIPSTHIWKLFLKTFEDIARVTDKTIIDATEGGALIKGTQIRTLSDTLEEYCKSELPLFKELVDDMQVSDEYINSARESSYTGIVNILEAFQELLTKVKTGIKRNKKATAILEAGIKTQNQLDRIYDTLDYVDNEIVKAIAREPLLLMLFQYPIYSATRAINTLNTDKYTLETIQFNLKLHGEMLQLFELYTNKMIRVMIEGLKDNREFFRAIINSEIRLSNLMEKHNYLYESDEYCFKLM